MLQSNALAITYLYRNVFQILNWSRHQSLLVKLLKECLGAFER